MEFLKRQPVSSSGACLSCAESVGAKRESCASSTLASCKVPWLCRERFVSNGNAWAGVGDDCFDAGNRGDVHERDFIDLRAVDDENLLTPGAEHCLLCLRVELIGVGDARFAVEPLAGDEDLVHVIVAEILFALAANQRQRLRLESAAGEQNRPGFHVCQLHHQLDRVGNDCEVFLVAQLFRAEQRRRAVINHQMVPIVDHLADEVGNLVFEFDVRLAADGVGQVGFCAVAEDGAAVGFGGVALFFELVEVAADGFLCDLIVSGKLADQNALFGAEFLPFSARSMATKA